MIRILLAAACTLAAVSASAADPVPNDPELRWLKGNIHTHSLWSDGDDFPEMIAVGEESGSLDEMSGKVADFYEEDVDNAVDNLSSLLEPMIMAILGVLGGEALPVVEIHPGHDIYDYESKYTPGLSHYDVPAELETIVRTLLQKDPNNRYESAADVRDDVRTDLAHLRMSARRALDVELALRGRLIVGDQIAGGGVERVHVGEHLQQQDVLTAACREVERPGPDGTPVADDEPGVLQHRGHVTDQRGP